MEGKEGGKGDDKPREIFDLLNLRILGIDFGELIKSWIGPVDVRALLENPEEAERLRARIEEQRARFQEAQEKLREKYGDAVRIDYDLRIGSLFGGPNDIRIGSGEFFRRLDELAKERAEWMKRGEKRPRVFPLRKFQVPKEPEVREPQVEVLEQADSLEVIADIPGVDEKDIKLDVAEDKITITAGTEDRRYHGEVTLSSKVEPLPLQQTYVNGMLKVKLKKK